MTLGQFGAEREVQIPEEHLVIILSKTISNFKNNKKLVSSGT